MQNMAVILQNIHEFLYIKIFHKMDRNRKSYNEATKDYESSLKILIKPVKKPACVKKHPKRVFQKCNFIHTEIFQT